MSRQDGYLEVSSEQGGVGRSLKKDVKKVLQKSFVVLTLELSIVCKIINAMVACRISLQHRNSLFVELFSLKRPFEGPFLQHEMPLCTG